MSAAAQRATRVPRVKTDQALQRVFEKYKVNPEKLVETNAKGHYYSVDELLKLIRKETKVIKMMTICCRRLCCQMYLIKFFSKKIQ